MVKDNIVPIRRQRPRYYRLVGHDTVPIPNDDVLAFAKTISVRRRGWDSEDPWRVAFTDCGGDVSVSTVFLGADHNFFDDGPPLLFESMIFGGEHGHDMIMTSTWEQAEAAHAALVALTRATGTK